MVQLRHTLFHAVGVTEIGFMVLEIATLSSYARGLKQDSQISLFGLDAQVGAQVMEYLSSPMTHIRHAPVRRCVYGKVLMLQVDFAAERRHKEFKDRTMLHSNGKGHAVDALPCNVLAAIAIDANASLAIHNTSEIGQYMGIGRYGHIAGVLTDGVGIAQLPFSESCTLRVVAPAALLSGAGGVERCGGIRGKHSELKRIACQAGLQVKRGENGETLSAPMWVQRPHILAYGNAVASLNRTICN